MKPFALFFAAAMASTVLPALAQKAAPQSATAAAAKTDFADGEVRRIDKARGTILLKHGEIKSVGMGAMTMGFKLKDPKMADGLVVGDKVKFAAEQKGDDLIVTSIQKSK